MRPVRDSLGDVASGSFGAYGRNRSVTRLSSPSGRTWIAYREMGPFVVALGGAAGDAWELAAVRRRFAELAGRRAVLWYGAGPDLPGARRIRLGQEAIVRTAAFTLRGRRMNRLRSSLHIARREGVRVEEWRWAALPEGVRAELRAVEAGWRRAHLVRLSFSLSRFEDAIADERAWVLARRGERVEAFATFLASVDRRGLVGDLMRRRPDAAPGAMDAVLAHAVERARERGLDWVSLGLARAPGGQRWHVLSPPSLRAYKDKFRPEWQDRFLVLPPGPVRGRLGILAVLAAHLAPAGPPRTALRRSVAAAVAAGVLLAAGFPILHRDRELPSDVHTAAVRVSQAPTNGLHSLRTHLPRSV